MQESFPRPSLLDQAFAVKKNRDQKDMEEVISLMSVLNWKFLKMHWLFILKHYKK